MSRHLVAGLYPEPLILVLATLHPLLVVMLEIWKVSLTLKNCSIQLFKHIMLDIKQMGVANM